MNYPDVIYGFANISYSSYAGQYPAALVLAVPFGGQLTIQNYSEEGFDQGIHGAQAVLSEILTQLEEILKEQGIAYWIPPMAQNNEEELVAPFSFKYAAVNAGLGWIGKNDVVITERYGPRVRLLAILIDHEFSYGQPMEESRCPASCRKCIDICPYHALHNVSWNIHSLRSEIIDYQLCNQKRSLYLKRHGRKNACGLCIAVCPFGT